MLTNIYGVLVLCAGLVGVFSLLALVFSKRRQRWGLSFVICLVAFFGFSIQMSSSLDNDARQAGFIDYKDQSAARKAGYIGASAWAAAKPKVEATEAAEAERQAAAKTAAEADKARRDADPDYDCRQQLKCWGEKAAVIADVKCASQVERFASYDYQWTNGWLMPKFTRYKWAGEPGGTVTLIGDSIKFQNGFGAWQNAMYRCDVDPATEAVSNVDVTPGRLPE